MSFFVFFIAILPILLFHRIEFLISLVIFSYIGGKVLEYDYKKIREDVEFMKMLFEDGRELSYLTEIVFILITLLSIYIYVYHFSDSTIAGIISALIFSLSVPCGSIVRKLSDPKSEKLSIIIGNISKIIVLALIIGFYYVRNDIIMMKVGSFAYIIAESIIFQGKEI